MPRVERVERPFDPQAPWCRRRRRRCSAAPRRVQVEWKWGSKNSKSSDSRSTSLVQPNESCLPGAEQVLFLELDRAGVLAALPVEVDARVQRPGVARAHLEVDGGAVVRRRPDHGVVEVIVGAQDAFGFLHDAVDVALAGLEQQLVADHLPARVDVELVRGAVEPAALRPVATGRRRRSLRTRTWPITAPAASSSAPRRNARRPGLRQVARVAARLGRGQRRQQQRRRRSMPGAVSCIRAAARSNRPCVSPAGRGGPAARRAAHTSGRSRCGRRRGRSRRTVPWPSAAGPRAARHS